MLYSKHGAHVGPKYLKGKVTMRRHRLRIHLPVTVQSFMTRVWYIVFYMRRQLGQNIPALAAMRRLTRF